MENNEFNEFNEVNQAGLPAKISVWTKVKNFLFQEITITETELELTPRQEKVFKAVHDFWCQEITGQKIKDFLFQEVKIIDNIEL